jgi:hypothetical protein
MREGEKGGGRKGREKGVGREEQRLHKFFLVLPNTHFPLPVTINWPYHSYVNTNIQVFVSFDGWQHPHVMSKKAGGGGWEATLLIPENIASFLCMFKIQGTWFYDLGQQTHGDEHGIVRNFYAA